MGDTPSPNLSQPNPLSLLIPPQVLPEHYPMVGACLLRAIQAVLGDAATDEVRVCGR